MTLMLKCCSVDAEWKPVAYASRSLSATEQQYAQIEEQTLDFMWASGRFSEFLTGKSFHIETDHKPLIPLLGSRNLDELPPRIQRLRMCLMKFSYTTSHVAGREITTADVLSKHLYIVQQRVCMRRKSTCMPTLFCRVCQRLRKRASEKSKLIEAMTK